MATAGGEGVPATGTQEGQADSHEAPQHLSEIRIILLGGRQVGKCSSGNTILGREEFKTGRKTYCVRRQGEVAGRQVTVVYTPGWRWKWWAPAQATPEHLKQDIRCSVSLCPPGPHAFLLVIPVDSPFTENHRRSVEEHLELLSERVWRHTMVLFTQAHALRDTTIEQHIEGAGEELQRLVEKCGNRYHVLNNRYRGDRTQVTELLEKIEDMVAVTSACYFSDEMERHGWRDEEPKGSRRKEPTAETAKRQFVKSNMRNSLVHPPNSESDRHGSTRSRRGGERASERERERETEDLRETVERCRGEIEELRETVRETVARHRETEELRETVERHTETEDLRETVERCRGEIEELRETVRETVERYRRETVTLGQGCETQARQQAEGSEAQPSVVKALL
nr:PREDICTED: GTPase IMAP family member 4-like [Lepisosteus oculatus]